MASTGEIDFKETDVVQIGMCTRLIISYCYILFKREHKLYSVLMMKMLDCHEWVGELYNLKTKIKKLNLWTIS